VGCLSALECLSSEYLPRFRKSLSFFFLLLIAFSAYPRSLFDTDTRGGLGLGILIIALVPAREKYMYTSNSPSRINLGIPSDNSDSMQIGLTSLLEDGPGS